MRKSLHINLRRFCLVLGIVVASLGLSQPQKSNTTTITVINTNDTGPGSLRQAVQDAVAGDFINFDSSLSGGTITLATSLIIDKDLNISAFATNPTIQITGGGSVCDTGGSTCVIKVESGVEVVFGAIDIVNGSGSGILNKGTLWVLYDTTISGNTSYYGGGIYSPEGIVYVDSSTISGNSAWYGGGIFASNLGITGSELFDNEAFEDGGAVHAGNSFSFLTSTFTNNIAGGHGGAVYHSSGHLTVSRSLFEGNTAEDGGAIYNNSSTGTLTVKNSTFFDNTAVERIQAFGGAINNQGAIVISNSTIAGNSATTFGGGLSNSGTLTFRNSILADHTGGGDCYNSGTILVNFHNLIEDGSCPSLITTDPHLEPLSGNGYTVKTMAIPPYSPAINAGDNGTCEGEDQRGIPRPQGGICDLGAYEFVFYTHTGLFSPPQRTWYLNKTHIDGWGNLQTVRFGSSDTSWIPVVGDWNGTGWDHVGIYSPPQRTWYLKDANDDGWSNVQTVRFGADDTSWVPVVGDWNGDGFDTIGMYSPPQRTWYLKDANDDGWGNVQTVRFGSADTSWVPVVGDWDGDGVDTIGLYSPDQKSWYLKEANNDGWGNLQTVRFGSDDTSWIPVVGDWWGSINDEIGLYSPLQRTWYLKYNIHADGWNNITTVRFGASDPSFVPVTGKWQSSP